jgi:hypothetical protein
MAKKKQKEPEKTQKSLYLQRSMWSRIEKRATEQRRSINNVIEIVLDREFPE